MAKKKAADVAEDLPVDEPEVVEAVDESVPQLPEPADDADGSEVQAATTAEETAQSLRDLLKEKGIPFSGETDDEALESVQQLARQAQEATRRAQQLQPYYEHWNQIAPQYQQFQTWQQQQFAAAQKPVEPEPLWNPPKVPESYRNWVTTDESGNQTFKADTPPDIKKAVSDYVTYKQNWVERLTTNPQEALAPFIASEAKKIVQEQLGQSVSQIEGQAFQRAWLSNNAHWVYEQDDSGRPIYDPITGQGKVGYWGQRFGSVLADLYRGGMVDTQAALSAAQRQVALEAQLAVQQSQPAAASETSAPSGADRKLALLKNTAQKTSNRGGSIPKSDGAPAQNGLLSLKQMLQQDFREAGIDLNAGVA